MAAHSMAYSLGLSMPTIYTTPESDAFDLIRALRSSRSPAEIGDLLGMPGVAAHAHNDRPHVIRQSELQRIKDLGCHFSHCGNAAVIVPTRHANGYTVIQTPHGAATAYRSRDENPGMAYIFRGDLLPQGEYHDGRQHCDLPFREVMVGMARTAPITVLGCRDGWNLSGNIYRGSAIELPNIAFFTMQSEDGELKAYFRPVRVTPDPAEPPKRMVAAAALDQSGRTVTYSMPEN